MKLRSNSKALAISAASSITLVLLVLIPRAAVGSDAPEQVAEAAPEARPTLIEEIEVIGQRPLRMLRQDIRENEQAMYALFNELNSTDDFDIDCAMITHTGTRIPVWECDVGYIKKARAQDVRDFLDFGVPMRSDAELFAQFANKSAELNAEMLALAKQHPELAEAMITLHARKQRLEAVKEQQQGRLGSFLGRLVGKEQD